MEGKLDQSDRYRVVCMFKVFFVVFIFWAVVVGGCFSFLAVSGCKGG